MKGKKDFIEELNPMPDFSKVPIEVNSDFPIEKVLHWIIKNGYTPDAFKGDSKPRVMVGSNCFFIRKKSLYEIMTPEELLQVILKEII